MANGRPSRGRRQRCRAREDEAKKEVTSATNAFDQALRAADAKKLESLTDEAFLATTPDGNQVTRKQFLDQVQSGRLKYPETQG